jgi:two-component system phosphate regulon response regulator PhoB
MPDTILVIEDEADVVDLIRHHLKKAKFRVLTADNGVDGLQQALEEQPNAVILDIMMPRLNGFEVAKKLRSDPRTEQMPLLILSAKGEAESRIKGLEVGADDYLPKPFSPKELVLRVQGILRRRGNAGASETVSCGSFLLDRAALKITLDGKRLDLTSTEFKLLSLLIGKQGTIQSREDLLRDVWAYSNTVDTRTVDTHMRRLREKLGLHAAQLETVRGEGYRFIAPLARG